MTINYKCLGQNEKTRDRRFQVMSLYLKGGTPAEICKQIGKKDPTITIKIVYNDISHIRDPKNKLHDLSIDMIRDLANSFYDLKITELERKLSKYENNPAIWLGIQKQIVACKDASLKLQGVMVEKVEHSGEVTNILEVRYEDRPEDNDRDKT